MATKGQGFTVEPVVERPWRRRIVAGLLAVAAAIALSFGGYWTWLNTPPGMPETADDAKALLASARFRNLSPDRRADYLEKVRELLTDMPDDQRRELFRGIFEDEASRDVMMETFRAAMAKRARQFAAADEEGQKRMVDEMLAQMQASGGGGGMRGMWGGGMRGPGGGGGGDRGPGGWGGPPGAGGPPGPGGPGDWGRRASEEELAKMTEEERKAYEEERQKERERRDAERDARMQQEMATGNPQDRELISGMMRAVRQEAERRGIDMGRGRGEGGRDGRGGGGGPR